MDKKKHIILIDDEETIHKSLNIMLLGSIYRMTSIIDPDEAMLYQQSKNKYDKPDLFIIDLMMGKVSGVDVINSIRSDPSFDNIPIILYTGFYEQIINELEILSELKISCILPKIIFKDELLPRLDTLVGVS